MTNIDPLAVPCAYCGYPIYRPNLATGDHTWVHVRRRRRACSLRRGAKCATPAEEFTS